MIMDLGKIGAQLPRDLDRRRLKIDCVDFHLSRRSRAHNSTTAGNIAGAGRQIDNAQFIARGESSAAENNRTSR